jgi:cytochrome oxidase Cu insertion factor (SCO1/SenC/PrrC family)
MRLIAAVVQLILLSGSFVALAPSTTAQNRTSPIAVSEIAPDFTLESHRGTKVTLSEAREKSPVVLVFYRGYW